MCTNHIEVLMEYKYMTQALTTLSLSGACMHELYMFTTVFRQSGEHVTRLNQAETAVVHYSLVK